MKEITKIDCVKIIQSHNDNPGTWTIITNKNIVFKTGNYGYRDVYIRDGIEMFCIDIDYKSGGKVTCWDMRK